MARDFSGSASDYLQIGDVAALDITGTALTIAAWINHDGTGADASVLAKDDGQTGGRLYNLSVTAATRVQLRIGDDSTPEAAAGATNISTGVWHHIAGVKDGTGASALRAYLNGTQDAAVTSNDSITDAAVDVRIGRRAMDAAPQVFNGRIAEVAIWNVALTVAEIAALAKGVSPSRIRPLSLKGYWPLHGYASPEPDFTSNKNVATVTGTVPAFLPHAPAGRPVAFAG